MTYTNGRPRPLAHLFVRIDALIAVVGDPYRAALQETDRLSERQAQEMFDLVWGEGAPLRGGGLGFSKREADMLECLAVRLHRPLVWEHFVVTLDGVKYGAGRYVEQSE